MCANAETGSPVKPGLRTVAESALVHTHGTVKVPQWRAKIASDMAHTPVLIKDSILLDNILAIPPDIALPSRPERKTCPFTDLAGANKMEEADVSALFVRCISLMNQGFRHLIYLL